MDSSQTLTPSELRSTTPPPKRSEQLVGVHFTSPKKLGGRLTKKSKAVINRPDLALRRQELEKRINSLTSKPFQEPRKSDGEAGVTQYDLVHSDDIGTSTGDIYWEEHSDALENVSAEPDPVANDTSARRRGNELSDPNSTTQKLFSTWLLLIPAMVPHYLAYLKASQRRFGSNPDPAPFSCPMQTCPVNQSQVLCLYFDCKWFENTETWDETLMWLRIQTS